MKIFKQGILFAATILTLHSYVRGANTDQVDFVQTQLDSQVKDILWCGRSNEAILVITETGNLYRSRDRGQTWKKM